MKYRFAMYMPRLIIVPLDVFERKGNGLNRGVNVTKYYVKRIAIYLVIVLVTKLLKNVTKRLKRKIASFDSHLLSY